jgi:membrane-bound ClpP family serine protease
MYWLMVSVLILIGLIFLVLEILVIPGAGFAGVIGFILIAVGVWQSYAHYGVPTGHFVLAATFLLTVLTLIFTLRGKTWKRMMLSSESDSKVNVIDPEKLKVGDTGKAISRLVPGGKAIINGEFYEVRTQGNFIDQETDIVVERIDHNKIYVKRKE